MHMKRLEACLPLEAGYDLNASAYDRTRTRALSQSLMVSSVCLCTGAAVTAFVASRQDKEVCVIKKSKSEGEIRRQTA